eukprot:Gb_00735 [translate_table: standard]
MAKGDDAIVKKRNKVIRKRMRKDLANSTEYINGVVAAKRRRKAGKRRICEAMCYSLPTPENPFNDQNNYKSHKKQRNKKQEPSEAGVKIELHKKKRNAVPQKRSFVEEEVNPLLKTIPSADKVWKPTADIKDSKQKEDKLTVSVVSSPGLCRITEHLNNLRGNVTPGMVFKLTLDAIKQTGFEGGLEKAGHDKMITDNKWGMEFWEACSKGSNVLGIFRASFGLEETAWIVSAAASHVAEKRMRDSLISNPVVLFVVASQEQAVKVRMVCKPLRKVLGIRSVSLHPGASLDHQIQGLRMYVPEILVSTPERLSGLLALEALDISSISLLVIDGLKTIVDGGFLDDLKSLRLQISGNPQTVVLSDTYVGMCTTLAQHLLKSPIQRVSVDTSIALQSVCITQSVSVFTSEEKKMQKALKILRQTCDNEQSALFGRIAIMVGNVGKAKELVPVLEAKGYLVKSVINNQENQGKVLVDGPKNHSGKRLPILVTTENLLDERTLGEVQVVLIYDFPSSLQTYNKVLTRMARNSLNGALYSFCSGADAPLAAQLIQLLEQCSQKVPQTLQMLSDAASVIKK